MLVVEDEAAILLQLEFIIEDEGHDVVGTATTCRDAIAKLDTTTPDIVFLDLNLADGPTGLTVADAARNRGIEIVFMTANPSRVEDFEGAAGALAKPFSRTAVIGTVRFVAQCIRTPPPSLARPREFDIGATFARRAGILPGP